MERSPEPLAPPHAAGQGLAAGERAALEQRPELSRRQVVLLMAALMLGVALAALDANIVGTALPTIVADLGGVSLYSWLVAVYLLTSTTTVPLYGRLADLWGRKPVFLVGIALFIAGSALCGLARSMPQLIFFRALQGLGAGAIMPMAMTILGDVFTIERRARMQGFFSAVWGTSSILGPSLGALILTVLSWPWIFLVNVPVGLLALLLVGRAYHETVVRRERSIDVRGAVLLTLGTSLLLLALQQHRLMSPEALGLFLLAGGCLGAFVAAELRVPDPIIPFSLLGRPLIGASYLISAMAGCVQFGVSAFVPLFVQGAMGGTALNVGAVLAPMSLGWPVGSILSGRLILRVGYKRVLLAGMLAALLGAAALQTLSVRSSLGLVMAIVALVGLGMGLSSTPMIIAVQNAVHWHQRGVATALVQFSRTIGGSLGVALMGALLNAQLGLRLGGTLESEGQIINTLLDPARRGTLAAGVVETVQVGLAGALHTVYLVPFGAALVGLTLALLVFPGGRVDQHVVRR
jgi:EmrB/QacA subfamily drug resistance transporter